MTLAWRTHRARQVVTALRSLLLEGAAADPEREAAELVELAAALAALTDDAARRVTDQGERRKA